MSLDPMRGFKWFTVKRDSGPYVEYGDRIEDQDVYLAPCDSCGDLLPLHLTVDGTRVGVQCRHCRVVTLYLRSRVDVAIQNAREGR